MFLFVNSVHGQWNLFAQYVTLSAIVNSVHGQWNLFAQYVTLSAIALEQTGRQSFCFN